jgi:hypothetical protein
MQGTSHTTLLKALLLTTNLLVFMTVSKGAEQLPLGRAWLYEYCTCTADVWSTLHQVVDWAHMANLGVSLSIWRAHGSLQHSTTQRGTMCGLRATSGP